MKAILCFSLLGLAAAVVPTAAPRDGLAWIEIDRAKSGFIQAPSGERFVPWGFNYDHDDAGRLLEDYWEAEWPKVEADFLAMKRLGANVVRIHLQFGRFMEGPQRPNAKALERFAKLIVLAERIRLHLDVTGLGCYHRQDVPAWLDQLDEAGRWEAQAQFWKAVAAQGAASPAIFCWDLMNEPVVPGGRREPGAWLGPPFAGKSFVQFVTLDQQGRPRPEIARAWTKKLAAAVRSADRRHLVTAGLVDWSLDRPGLTSGFVPSAIAPELDFLCVHLYPESGKMAEAAATLKGFAVGKPVVVEETFPLKCAPKALDEFIAANQAHAAGWISFYWGKPPEELKRSGKLGDAILLQWLDLFAARARGLKP